MWGDRGSSSASTTGIATGRQRFRQRRSVQIARYAPEAPLDQPPPGDKVGSVASSSPRFLLACSCWVGVVDLASLSPRPRKKKTGAEKKAHGERQRQSARGRTNRPGAGAASPARPVTTCLPSPARHDGCRPSCVSNTTPADGVWLVVREDAAAGAGNRLT